MQNNSRAIQQPLEIAASSPEVPEKQEKQEKPRYLFLTNQNNLSDILSSGFIKPRSYYGPKYYHDPGYLCDRGIPVFVERPSADFIQMIIDEDGTIPVLLELQLDNRYENVHTIDKDYQLKQDEALSTTNDIICAIVFGVIPINCIKNIHFCNENHYEEYRLREYGNIRMHPRMELFASASLFDGPSLDNERLMQTLKQANEHIQPFSMTIWRQGNALNGALLMIGKLIEQYPSLPLKTLAIALGVLQEPTDLRQISRAIGTDMISCFMLLPSMLLIDLHNSELWLDRVTTALEKDMLVEALLFIAIIRVLLQFVPDPETYVNIDALRLIRKDFAELVSLVPHERLDDRRINDCQSLLDFIEEILSNEQELAKFPSRKMPIATALLYFLKRSTPQDAFSWLDSKPLKELDSIALAIVYSGLLYGRAEIPIAYRASLTFEQYIDNRLVGALGQTYLTDPPRRHYEVEVSRNNSRDKVQEVLKVDKRPLIKRLVLKSAQTPLGKSAEPPYERRIEKNKVDNAQYQVLRALQEADLKSGAPKDAAIYLCQKEGWAECVFTMIPADRKTFSIFVGENGETYLRMQGFPPTLETIIVVERFRKRLTDDAWRGLSEQIREEITKLMQAHNPMDESDLKSGKKKAQPWSEE